MDNTIIGLGASPRTNSASGQVSILYDLAYACWPGTSGIPQDTRMTYRALAAGSFQLTGLLREPNGYNTTLSISRQITPEGKALDVEASNFFLGLSGVTPLESKLLKKPKRLWYTLWRWVENFRSGGCIPQLLNKNIFFDIVWRMAFERSLPPEDRALFEKTNLTISNLTVGDVMRSLASPYFRPPRLQTEGFDFAIFQNGTPLHVSPGTIKVDRIYDMIPITDSDTIHGNGGNQANIHYHSIARGIGHTHYVCISEASRQDLIKVFPQLKNRSYTIPCSVSDQISPLVDYLPPVEIVRTKLSVSCVFKNNDMPPAAYHSLQQQVIARAQLDKPLRYIMTLSTIEPRKNLISVIRAWEQLLYRGYPELKLIIVGKEGWRYQAILEAMAPRVVTGQLLHLKDLSFPEIQSLYKSALCLVSPSYNEGFNLPPMEAFNCGTPSVLSDIPVHHWVMEEAALYASPYDIDQLSQQIERLVSGTAEAQALRQELLAKGRHLTKRYAPDTVAAQWNTLLQDLYAREKGRSVLTEPIVTSPQDFAA